MRGATLQESIPSPSSGSSTPGIMARATLLSVTILGTIANNVINVPLRAIAAEFDAETSKAVLTVTVFILVLAFAMPLVGWLGDRIGRKHVILGALVLMTSTQIWAASAPTLNSLICARAVQGLACSAFPPIVMGMLSELYPKQRIRAMGSWAAANGLGQAIGPPVGGLINDALGWRWIFGLLGLVSLVTCIATWFVVPATRKRFERLHIPSALLLTGGTGALLAAFTLTSQHSIPVIFDISAGTVGVLLLICFVIVSRNQPRAIIPPHLLVETKFFRSSVAVFCQMFVLGSTLVAVPLILTGPMELSTSIAGIIFFTLPLMMTVMAPIVGRLGGIVQPVTLLRAGLGVLILASLLLGQAGSHPQLVGITWIIVALLGALGIGVAMVQTPSASGATNSPAGQRGAALGIFSMLRFSGAAVGTAWVALILPSGHTAILFIVAGGVAAFGFAMSFFTTPSTNGRGF